MSVGPNLENCIHQIRSYALEQPHMLEIVATFKTGGAVRPNPSRFGENAYMVTQVM
jgi:hypothetical protein